MGVDVNIKEDNTKKILSEEAEAVRIVLDLVGGFVEDEAKMNLQKNGSIDTGNLWNSITHEVKQEEKAVYIGTAVEYAPYVEYGHRVGTSDTYVPPKPYLMPAVSENTEKITSFFEKHLGSAEG